MQRRELIDKALPFLYALPLLFLSGDYLSRPDLVLSVDAMKSSRDHQDLTANQIDLICAEVAKSRATHIAIGTPYDDFAWDTLTNWISRARSHGLHVWLRGNFCDWENWWPDQPHIPLASASDHHAAIRRFLTTPQISGLLQSGDLFSPCPEPENGLVIGPYWSHKPELQKFIIDSYSNARSVLAGLRHPDIRVIFSYNADVAADLPPTLYSQIGNIIGLDHHPAQDPTEIGTRIRYFQNKFPDKEIWITETSAGMKQRQDIGSESRQAEYLDLLLQTIRLQNINHINYWVIMEGDTALIDAISPASVSERPAYQVLSRHYRQIRRQG